MTDDSAPTDADVDVIARAIHRAYTSHMRGQGDTPETNRSITAWDDLPDSLKESSRDQARHLGEHMASIGCVIVARGDIPGGAEVVDAFDADEVEAVAQSEHRRWVRQRRDDGWRLSGPPKDVEAKLTPDLVAWGDLSEDTRDLDRLMIRELPGFVAAAGCVVVRWPQPRDAR